MAVEVGSAVGYLDLDISGFLSGLKQANEEAGNYGQKIEKAMSEKFKSAGQKISSAGSTLTKTVTLPLVGLGTAGMKVATDFEKAMSEVRAITGATGDNVSGDFSRLRNEAIELGASTAFSAGEVANAMTEMAKAGWNTEQIIDGMAGVLDAAAASGENLGSVSTIVADAITGFGLAASDSSRIADLLTQAANAGTIGINDLGESFKYIAPVAQSMGLSVEDVTTAISAMSMAGIKGSQAGTSLRGVLTRMVKPTDAVAAAMGELDIVLTNQDGTFKSLDTIVAEMRTSFSGLTDEQNTYYAAVLAGQEGMSGLLSLLNLTQEEYDAISESMYGASGVAKETAEVMQDNLQSKLEQFLGSLESLAIVLADNVIPALTVFIEWLTGMVEKFTALDPVSQKMILIFAGIALAIGPVLSIVGKLTTGVGGIISIVEKFGGAASKAAPSISSSSAALGGMAKSALSMAGAGAGIMLAAAGLALLAQSSISLANAGWPAIAVMGGMVVALAGLAAGASVVAPALTAGAVGLVAFGGAVTLVGVGVLAASAGISLLAEKLPIISEHGAEAAKNITLLGGAMTAFGAGILVASGGAATLGIGLLSVGTGAAAAVVGVTALGVSMLVLATATASTARSVNAIEDSASSAAASLEEMVTSVDVVETGLNSLESIANKAVSAFVNVFTTSTPKAGSAAKSMATAVTKNVKEGLAPIPGNTTETMNKMNSAVSSGMTKMNSTIRQGFASATSYIKSVANQSYSWGADVMQGLVNGIYSKMGSLKSAVNQAAKVIYSNLHFSRPDEGPLRDYETWMPDFMQGLAKGIHDNSHLVKSAVQDVASDMKLDDVEDSKTELFTAGDTETLKTYNVTLLNTVGLYKQLVEQMRMCSQYSGIVSGDSNLLSPVIAKAEEKVREKPETTNKDNEAKKPDTLTIPISIGEEHIENVVVDLLRREVRV